MCARDVDHAQHLAQAAGLHQLEVHAVDATREVRDVGRIVCALVRVHRDAAALAHPAQAVEIAARHRLLDQLELERLDAAQHAHGVRRRPRAVRIDADAPAIAATNALEVLDVARAPSFTLSIGNSRTESSFFSISSGLAMPSVTHDSGVREGSTPSSFHTGTPRRLPAQSCSAVSIAARAAPWPCSAPSSRA
jgi:hypothetical protein